MRRLLLIAQCLLGVEISGVLVMLYGMCSVDHSLVLAGTAVAAVSVALMVALWPVVNRTYDRSRREATYSLYRDLKQRAAAARRAAR